MPRGTDSDAAHLTARALAMGGTDVEQATPGDAGSRAEKPWQGPTGSTRAGDSRAGTLAEPLGARARYAWGRSRIRPETAGGQNRSKDQNVSLGLAVS